MRTIFPIAAVLLPTLVAAADGPPVRVEQAVERPVMRVVSVTGTVTSPRTAVLSTAVAGLVAAIDVDAGDRVGRGDVIVELDAELAELERRRLAANAEAAQVALAEAERRYDEAERVRGASAISETEVRAREAAVRQSAATLRAANAALARQRAVLARHRIRAPFDGVIGERLAELGEWVDPGTGIVELVATDALRFDLRVPQEFYGLVSTDTPIELSSDAVPGLAVPGRISAAVPVSEPGARTFLLRVETDSAAAGSLTPGMSARGVLNLSAGRTGVVISRNALLRFPDGRDVVWVVDTSSERPRVRQREVDVGLTFDGLVEISAGLSAGTTVVTQGNEALQQDQTVTLVAD